MRYCLPCVIVVLYCLIHVYLYVKSLWSVSYERRIFTAKELSDGPLVFAESVKLNGRGNVVKVNDLSILLKKTVSKADFHSATTAKFEPPKFSESVLEELEEAAFSLKNSTDLIYFTFVNEAFEQLLFNWICNVRNFSDTLSRLLIVATNEALCNRIEKEFGKLSCISLQLDGYDDALDWGRNKYIELLLVRTQLITTLVKSEIRFVVVEPDAVWLRDPIELFRNQSSADVDIVVPVKGYTKENDTLSFDPLLIRPTLSSKKFFEEMLRRQRNSSAVYDQDILNELCRTSFSGVRCDTFTWNNVADGKWFKLSERERESTRPYIVNNNFYVGAKNKQSRQAINGFWFLSKKRHCLQSKVHKAISRFKDA